MRVSGQANRILAALPGEAERYVVHIESALNAARGAKLHAPFAREGCSFGM
ncbi:hypothetical protein [Burkholderia territorii]|uniref:hypothetical protein n=1 Tax=Burkholderia territorii TaxID=1503055 RepID=UPI000B0E8F01|nr:hypothetical protein [Burkholderia territorii]